MSETKTLEAGERTQAVKRTMAEQNARQFVWGLLDKLSEFRALRPKQQKAVVIELERLNYDVCYDGETFPYGYTQALCEVDMCDGFRLAACAISGTDYLEWKDIGEIHQP